MMYEQRRVMQGKCQTTSSLRTHKKTLVTTGEVISICSCSSLYPTKYLNRRCMCRVNPVENCCSLYPTKYLNRRCMCRVNPVENCCSNMQEAHSSASFLAKHWPHAPRILQRWPSRKISVESLYTPMLRAHTSSTRRHARHP